MADERIARPVSGEIMSRAQDGDSSIRGLRDDDVVDAEFETVRLAGDSQPAAARPAADAPAVPTGGMETLRHATPLRGQRGGPLFWTFGLTLVLGAFWISGGHALVAAPSRPVQPSRPDVHVLRITNVTTRVVPAARESALLVDGEVRNGGADRRTVPPLSIVVTGKDGRLTRYFLGTNGAVVEPGASFSFSGRLAAPKDGVGTVTVDFRQEGEN